MNPNAAAGMMAGSMGIASMANAFTQVQAGRLNRSIMRFNADMAEIRARDARWRGQQALFQHGLKVASLKGSQRAAMAAAGIDVSAGGTADEILDDTQYWATVDRVTIQNNAAREAFGFQQQAAMDRAQGSAAARQANLQAIGTIAGGVSQSAMTYYQMRNA